MLNENAYSILPVSVLIATMNRTDSLMRTVKSFLAAAYLPSEIIIVDQTPNSDERRRTMAFLQTITEVHTVYEYQERPSSATARNYAAELAHEEILIYCDDDIDVSLDTVKIVYDRFQDSSVALISVWDSRCRNQPSKFGAVFDVVSNGVSPFKTTRGHVTASMLGGLPRFHNGEVPTEWAMGFFFAVRRSLSVRWDIRWDDELSGYAYGEDLDFTYRYCLRAKQEQLSCFVTKETQVEHLAAPQNRLSDRRFICVYILNRLYLTYKLRRGLRCRIAVHWRNWTMGLYRAARKNWKLQDVCFAYQLYRKHKAEIKAGYMTATYQDIMN